MKSICVLTDSYPNELDQTKSVFVRNLVWEWLDLGINITVVAPIDIRKDIKLFKLPYKTIEKNGNGKGYCVYRPKFYSLPGPKFSFINFKRFLLFSWISVYKQTINKNNIKSDCFYGHFISKAGLCAIAMGSFFSKPSFIAHGESTDWSIKNYSHRFLCRMMSRVSGVISVSAKNKDFLLSKNLCDATKIGVFINGVNLSHYYPRDKPYARSLFGIDKSIFTIAFVGHFIERKGIDKLNKIISQTDDYGAIFAGAGPLNPIGQNVLYAGLVEPEKMPHFLSATDIFVLPSKNEGCSNAILEALACGLPIISSDLPFNHDVLDDSCAILIDPYNEDEIHSAILKLKNDSELRKKLAQGSLEKSKKFSLAKRAENILRFMDEMA